MTTMLDVFTWLLVVLPAFDWVVAFVLIVVAALYPGILTLRERAIAGLILAIIATIASILASSRLGIFHVENDIALTLLALGMVLVSVPSVIWLFLLVTGRFRLPKEGA